MNLSQQRETADVPARRSRSGWTTRIMLILVTIGISLSLTAPSSQAMIIGPGPTPTYARNVDGEMFCSSTVLQISASTSVQENRFNGQYVTWRYYLTNNRGYAAYSSWGSGRTIAFNNYGVTGLGTATLRAQTNTTWDAQVQVAYWNGRNYTYSPWYAVGKRQSGYSDWRKECRT